MKRTNILAFGSIIAGVLTLYVGWGEGLGFVTLGQNACERTVPPQGLHLNDAGQIAYRRCQYVYDFAWPVFILVSLLGVTLLANGGRLYWTN
jgi:hypothetical protein